MSKKIYLKFDNHISELAGFDYGEEVYRKQAKDKDFDTIVFPDHIELIASSFTQGFFKDLLHQYGSDYILENYKIESVHDFVIEKVRHDIY